MAPPTADEPVRFISNRALWPLLSNFAPTPIVWDGRVWPTLEHAYQAAKTADFQQQEYIRAAPTPAYAKKLGRKVPQRVGWAVGKLELMEDLLCIKFAPGTPAAEMLLATGTRPIEEDAKWDDFFGTGRDGRGLNWMGRLLMDVRGELAQGLANAQRGTAD